MLSAEELAAVFAPPEETAKPEDAYSDQTENSLPPGSVN